MQGTQINRRSGSESILGLGLIVIGIGVLVLRQVGVDLVDIVQEAGWPFFIIIPGLALLVMALVASRPHGLGFAIPGAIVTTVGLILLYQETTGHWESWAYAWALIPAGAGVGTALYGLYAGRRDHVVDGLRLAAIAGVVFVVGLWFFETIFDSGRAPIDLASWWPVLLIVFGVVLAVGALTRRSTAAEAVEGELAGGNHR